MLCAQNPVDLAADNDTIDHRVGLLHRAIEGAAWTITNVHAPAGYGKTHLLRAWRSALQDRGKFALCLDLAFLGGDPHGLCKLISRSLHGADVLDRVDLGDLAQQTADTLEQASVAVLILDHYPAGHTDLNGFVAAVISRSKGGLHLVVASRVPIALPMGEDICRFEFTAFSIQELALTLEEVRASIGASNPGLDPVGVHEITDGWPWAVAALKAIISDRPGANAAALREALTDPDGGFACAVSREVLGHLAEDDVDLLTQTSFLKLLSPDVVAAIAPGDGAWRILDRLRQIGLLTPNRDANHNVGLRCHGLIRAILQRRLLSRGEWRMEVLHHRAALHFMERGDLESALHHAVAGGDAELATEVFLKSGGVAIGVRDGCAVLQETLDLLPSASLADPRVRAAVAFCMIKAGRTGVGLEILVELSSHRRSENPDALLLRDIRLVELLAIAFGISALGPAESDSNAHLRHGPSTESALMQGVFYNLRCGEALKQGRVDHALSCADTAVYFYQAANAVNGIAHMRLHSARIHRLKGDADKALEDLQQARQLSIEKAAPDLGCMALADLQIGALKADAGDLVTASMLCAAAMPRAEAGERQWEALYEGYVILSAASAFAIEADPAHNVLRSGLMLARLNGCTELETMLRLRILREAVLGGAIGFDAAMAAFDDIPLGTDWMVRHARTSLGAYLLAEAGDLEEGLSLLDEARNDCLRGGLLKCAVEISLDRAMMLERAGRRADAIASTWEGLTMAEPINLIGPFIERRGLIHAVLVQAQAERGGSKNNSTNANFGARVLGKLFAQEEGRPPPLSIKERAIMNGLAEGKSNKEIARILNISPETIRFHLKNVYSKLGVQAGRMNRQIAADFARQLVDQT